MLLIVTQKEEVGVQRENPTQSQRQHGRKEPDDQQKTKKQFEEPQDDRQQKKRVREQEEDDQQHQTEKKKKKQTPEEEEKEEEEKLQITPKVEAELVRMTPAPVISKLLTHLYLHMRKITPVECSGSSEPLGMSCGSCGSCGLQGGSYIDQADPGPSHRCSIRSGCGECGTQVNSLALSCSSDHSCSSSFNLSC
ncbi:putative uncharacterized protein DDB_G0274435 isoform X3 [Amphiprion ocellaris]|uniref:putative uncharacterized protein DDB_G0274435 isoform X3 n=1 Tax=Amphiprion ocellaris TaxID=80972 RepID=UPI002410B903|nr:putative uncharacterized protein DDB_G0274435 isoform X3 [Amphiprion ocellaris]